MNLKKLYYHLPNKIRNFISLKLNPILRVGFFYYICFMGKLKQYLLTTIINGVEVDVLCITNSRKKFSNLLDKSYSYVSEYSSEMGYMVDECFDNPNVLFIQRGLGGETLDIFERDKIYSYDDAVELIKKHREKYPNTRSWYDSKS